MKVKIATVEFVRKDRNGLPILNISVESGILQKINKKQIQQSKEDLNNALSLMEVSEEDQRKSFARLAELKKVEIYLMENKGSTYIGHSCKKEEPEIFLAILLLTLDILQELEKHEDSNKQAYKKQKSDGFFCSAYCLFAIYIMGLLTGLYLAGYFN